MMTLFLRLPFDDGCQLTIRDHDDHTGAEVQLVVGTHDHAHLDSLVIGHGPTPAAAVEAAATLFQNGLTTIDSWQLENGDAGAQQRLADRAHATIRIVQEKHTEGFWSGVMAATGVMLVLIILTVAVAVFTS